MRSEALGGCLRSSWLDLVTVTAWSCGAGCWRSRAACGRCCYVTRMYMGIAVACTVLYQAML